MPAPEGGWTWPPTSVTLIAGEHEAILVDTLPTLEDAHNLADWIEATGRDLTTIYLAHGHIDHYLGTATLLLKAHPTRLNVSTLLYSTAMLGLPRPPPEPRRHDPGHDGRR